MSGARGGASLAERALDTIRDSILALELEPGSRIDEKVLMHRFGLSRTPAREALNRLASEGLVRIYPNRGPFVAPIDLEGARQFFDAYLAMERTVAGLCRIGDRRLADQLETARLGMERALQSGDQLELSRLNALFHGLLAEATGNEYLIGFSGRLHGHGRRLNYLVFRLESAQGGLYQSEQAQTDHDHRLISDAVRAADRARLVELLTGHALRFQQRVARYVGVSPGAGFPVVGAPS